MPGIWYQIGLHCNTVGADCPFDVTGFTFAGVPGRGHRPQRGTSPGGSPTSSRTSPTSTWRRSRRQDVSYDGKQLPLTEREEMFQVAGRTIREIDHGPVHQARSAASPTSRPSCPASGSQRGGRCGRSCSGERVRRRAGVDRSHSPAHSRCDLRVRHGAELDRVPRGRGPVRRTRQNLVYADTAGNIGYQAPGRSRSATATGTGDWPCRGLGSGVRLDRAYVPFRRAAQRVRPGRRASS